MKPESKLHKHPHPRSDGKYSYLHGQLLEPGDEIRPGDQFSRRDGTWYIVPVDERLFDLEDADFIDGIWVRPS